MSSSSSLQNYCLFPVLSPAILSLCPPPRFLFIMWHFDPLSPLISPSVPFLSFFSPPHHPASTLPHLLSLPPPTSLHFLNSLLTNYLLLISSNADTRPPRPTPQNVNLPPSPVTDRMAMPMLIRVCMARCSARLSGGLWERELLILASGDGLKTTGAKTSKHSLITLTH